MSISHKATYVWLVASIFGIPASIITGDYLAAYLFCTQSIALVFLAVEEYKNERIHNQ